MKKLAEDLKNGVINKCYLFFGEEKYLVNIYTEKMKAVIDKPSQAMNVDTFQGKTASVADIFDALDTMPFLSEYRLVLVKNSGLFATGRKNDSQLALERLRGIPQTGILVFVEENVDKRSSLYKAVSKEGRAVEFKSPDEKDLITWVVREMKALNTAIDKTVAAYLLRQTAGGMEAVVHEMDKLAAYCKDKGTVTQEDIDTVCVKSLETRVFTLVDALARQNSQKAVEIFDNLMAVKESPIMVLSLIARQFRLILMCGEMRTKPAGEIAATVGVPPFVVNECLKQRANFSRETLIQALKDCLEADVGIKSGKISDRAALEIILVKYGSKQI